MKKLAALPLLLAALPAAAHDAGPVAHAQPHGMETIVAIVAGACLLGYLAWKRLG